MTRTAILAPFLGLALLLSACQDTTTGPTTGGAAPSSAGPEGIGNSNDADEDSSSESNEDGIDT